MVYSKVASCYYFCGSLHHLISSCFLLDHQDFYFVYIYAMIGSRLNTVLRFEVNCEKC